MTSPNETERRAPAPSVSVIVGAYSRRAYVASAVRSVLDQQLPRGSFEVLVLKNFEDPALDRWLDEEGVRRRFDPQQHIGRWVLGAIRDARAPIVTFLDDDDLYAPQRLERLIEVYRTHPDLGFYHNRSVVIDREGVPVPPELWRLHESAPDVPEEGWYIPSADKIGRLPQLIRAQSDFNLSSMALRREDAVGELASILDGAQYVPDLPAFLIGLLSPRGIFVDGQRLTCYRHHGRNRTMDLGWLRDAEEDRRRLAAIARSRGPPAYADWLERLADHFEKLVRIDTIGAGIRGGAPRREVAEGALAYLRFLGRHPEERDLEALTWGIELFAGAYLVSPEVARRVRQLRDAQVERARRAQGFG